MPLAIGDYLKDTGRLTTEQHGAYLLLIMDYWSSGAPPDDDVALAAITGLDAKSWRKTRPVLMRYFVIENGLWNHSRVELELRRWTEKKRKFVERASAGGRAKAALSSANSRSEASKNGAKIVLNGCTSSSSTEVDALSEQSTLCGQPDKIFGEDSEIDWAAARKAILGEEA